MTSIMQEPFVNQSCDCGGRYVEPKNAQEWHLECNTCEKIMFCYVPMDHQAEFHADTHKFRLWAGG